MFGGKLRCPVCNQYAPDRCTCNKGSAKVAKIAEPPSVLCGDLRLICRSCAKIHKVESRFNASNLRTTGDNGEGGCNLCGHDVPLAEVRM